MTISSMSLPLTISEKTHLNASRSFTCYDDLLTHVINSDFTRGSVKANQALRLSLIFGIQHVGVSDRQ